MIENPIADAWRVATGPDEMGIAFVAPFRFTDNTGKERQCTALVPHLGAPMGTLISTRYDPDQEGFIAAVRGLGYYPVTLRDQFEKYDQALFVKTVKDWGWYGPEKLLPTFFEDPQDGSQGQ